MFSQAEYFINRELSWLKFNDRVLGEAADDQKPLLERLKFIAITGSNLDEFFMVRVAGLKHQQESGINKTDASGLTVAAQLQQIAAATHDLVRREYRFLKTLLKSLEEQDIYLTTVAALPDRKRDWVTAYFKNTVFPVITPLAVDASHPFPFLANRSLNLVFRLVRDKTEVSTAIIPVPAVLPRIVEVPGDGKKRRFVFLEDIIRQNSQQVFNGYVIRDVAPFRITRNADLLIDEEDAEDLLAEVEKSLRRRRRGQPVRLELGRAACRGLREFLIEELKIADEDVYSISGPLDTTCFMKFAERPEFAGLRYEPIAPQIPADLAGVEMEDLYETIRQRDVMVHHPYESFEPVIEFVRQAANDPRVLAIKQTLYRVSGNSPIVRALAQAAENGKQVTVLVELKARFDEENNILWARRLEEAGCHVIYGMVGLKTHAKMILVIRQESGRIKRYVHMGTGNYNDTTARLYTDMGIFTANDQFGADASGFFNVLSGYSDPPVWNKVVVAPLGLRERLAALIDREIEFARAGKPAGLTAKMNSLVDRDIIMKLYEASHAGVKIDLLVRGVCCLRPGIAGISDNISVRSIVGRFLEHSRVFYFVNGGEEKLYLSSADWMPRNLDDRVELFFPVEEAGLIERIKNILALQMKDNQKAYIMRNDGSYRRVGKRGREINSQEELYKQAVIAGRPPELPLAQRLQPMYRRED